MMLKFGTKALAVILSVLFVVQLLPMKVFAQEINTSTENTASDALSMDTVTDAEKIMHLSYRVKMFLNGKKISSILKTRTGAVLQ